MKPGLPAARPRLTRLARLLSQEIDAGALIAGMKQRLAGLTSRVILPSAPPVPRPAGAAAGIVLMAPPEEAILSFELALPPMAGIADATLIDNTFEAQAPFRRDAVFRAFQRRQGTLAVRYVPKKSVEPALAQWRAAGQVVDGLALDPAGTFTVLFDRRSVALRLVRARKTVLLGLSAGVLALLVMSQFLARQTEAQEALKERLTQLLAERRTMDRPGDAPFDAAGGGEVPAQGALVLRCLRAALPPEVAVSALIAKPDGTVLRLSPVPPAGLEDTLGAACQRAVKRNGEGALEVGPALERAP